MDHWNDEELVAAAQGGNVGAFEVLVRRHQGFIVATANRVVHNRATAEDLAQESFFRAWRSLREFRQDAQFRTWMYRITTNLALNHVSRSREVPVEDTGDRLSSDSTPDGVLRDEMEAAWKAVSSGLPHEL